MKTIDENEKVCYNYNRVKRGASKAQNKTQNKLSYNIYSDMKFSLNIKDDFKLIKFYTLIDNKKSYLKVMKDNTLKYYKVDGLRVKYLINDEFINDNIFIFVLKRIYNKIR